jgi:putative CocE/NonD family hydrolase
MPLKTALLAGAALALSVAASARAQAPASPAYNETPAKFAAVKSAFDYDRRDVMIPMRDGVKLHTVILVPKKAKHAGILLTRTPYNADELTGYAQSPHLAPILAGYDNAPDVVVGGGYIRVVQDVRGKYGSEGEYVMNRPLAGRGLNPTTVDHATDTYDTIDWLTKNVPETNGKVCILGISYDGFLPLMALVNPHPALKCSVPMNPMVDGWRGDDWFHNGAFRQQNLPYIYEQDGTRKNEEKWWSGQRDDYDQYMRAGSAGELGKSHGLEQTGFWRKILEHPTYDGFWQAQAMDQLLAKEPLKVPVLLVHSLWDAEDIYGAMAVYKAIKPKDPDGSMVRLAFGPWHHGQEIGPGTTMGAISFDSDTGKWFRQHVLGPYLAHYLQDAAPPLDLAVVTGFETGTNTWRRLPAWPAAPDGTKPTPTPLYLQPGMALGFTPVSGPAQTADYVSDPAKPVPYRNRPIRNSGYETPAQWADWLVDDQREPSGRPDVLTFTSAVLDKPIKIAGEPVVRLTASTSGTDSDWVVKLIDVYPDEVAEDPKLGGYQLAVAMDIFRGRYREGFETAKPLTPNAPLPYRFALPNTDHVFLPGHRIMVQVQSSWFPLYDRNPQTFVPSIFWAKPSDYKAATQKVVVSGAGESLIELPVVPAPAEAATMR